MAIRIMITMRAKSGKGGELAALRAERCLDVQKEPGCEQFEVFQSAEDPDKLILLERWADQPALDVHNEKRMADPNRLDPRDAELRAEGGGEVERYEYNRTR